MTPALLLGLLLAAPVTAGPVTPAKPAPPPMDLNALVKKTVDAYGGEAALKKAVAVRESGKVTSTMRQGAVGTMVRVRARPQKLRVEIAYPNEKPEVRVLDGQKGWRAGVEAKGPPFDAMVLQAARLELPLLLAEKRAELKDLGTIERDGLKLRGLEVPLQGGMALTVLVDPATFHILHSSGRAQSPMGPLEFASGYADFRKVQGLLFAFQEKTYAMGNHTGDTTLDKVEVMSAAPKDAFTP